VIGAAHSLAQQRIAERFGLPLSAAVASVLGRATPLEIVVARDWLLAETTQHVGGVGDETGAA
jgi:hypothetical protein